MHECLRCGFKDKQRYIVKRHLKKKNICKPILSDISVENCIKLLESKDVNCVKNIFMKEIEKLNEKLKSVSNNLTSGDRCLNQIGDHNTINHINITINPYDNTDYSVIKNDIHKCIVNGKLNETKLIKLLHFDKRFPQNHNVKIENKKTNEIKVYNGESFETRSTGQYGVKEFLDETIEKTEKELNKDYNVNDNHLIALQNAPVEYEGLKTTQQRHKINKVCNELYNGKNVVNKTHKS